MPTRRCLLVRSTRLLLAPQLAGAAAWAQKPLDWPNRVVRIVVPVAAGGPTDTVARVLADQLSKIWGYQVVVENKGGAGTNLGNEMAARADPDGYTVLFATSSTARNKLDPLADLLPVSLVSRFPLFMFVGNRQMERRHQDGGNQNQLGFAAIGA